jgi:hypothetical protein
MRSGNAHSHKQFYSSISRRRAAAQSTFPPACLSARHHRAAEQLAGSVRITTVCDERRGEDGGVMRWGVVQLDCCGSWVWDEEECDITSAPGGQSSPPVGMSEWLGFMAQCKP